MANSIVPCEREEREYGRGWRKREIRRPYAAEEDDALYVPEQLSNPTATDIAVNEGKTSVRE